MHNNDDINLAQIEDATQQAYAAAWTIISRIMPGTSKARASVMMLTAAAFHAGLEGVSIEDAQTVLAGSFERGRGYRLN
jgi:hypothetical protein